jgi:flavin-dependent dehydrogenase
VRATLAGQACEWRARVVVGADGHHSAIARLLELDRPPRWPRRIGLAAHVENFPLRGQLGEMHVATGGYCGMAPQEDGRVNAAMVVDLARFERRGCSVEDFFDAELRGYASMTARARAARRVTPVRGVGPLARRVRAVYGAGFVLVGDAAGFFDPFTGEGIYDALRGGELAADAIMNAVASGAVTAAALAPYAAARRAEFASKRRAALLVQAFVRSPRLLDYAVPRVAARPHVTGTLTSVLGDYGNAGVVLSPRFLWGALRP